MQLLQDVTPDRGALLSRRVRLVFDDLGEAGVWGRGIGVRVTDAEEAWLRAEMKRRKLTMSDLIRLILGKFHISKADTPRSAK